jgi:hypothetical protein
VEATTGADNEGTVERFDTTGKYRGTVDHGSLVDAQGDIVVVTTGSRLVSHDLASGNSRSFELGSHTRNGAIAPDSRSVALVSNLDNRLEILRLDSGSLEAGPSADPGSLQWTPSGRDVFFTTENQQHIDVWQVAERHHARVQHEFGFVTAVYPLPA